MQEFLAKNNIQILNQVSANKKLQAPDALKLAGEVDELYSIKGKKISYFHLKKEKPHEDALLKLMLGPTGNLRAPYSPIQKTPLLLDLTRRLVGNFFFEKGMDSSRLILKFGSLCG